MAVKTATQAAVEAGSFRYANPPTIHWGAGSVERSLEAELDRLGARRLFVVTTRSVDAHPDLGASLRKRLGDRVVGWYPAIGQHAPIQAVVDAVERARAAQPDALLSFGGGSPVDATKAVAFSLATGLDLAQPGAAAAARKLSLAERVVLPHVSIPTTLSVAELSGLAGFTTRDTLEKVGLRDPRLIPSAVLYDASLTLPTPLELWLATGIRALDHAVETIVAPGSHPFSDALALDGLRRLRESLLATRVNPEDLEARTRSQLGAWFTFTLPGPAASGLSHTLGKRIGSRHGIPHGATSCLLLPHVMRYLAPRSAPALAQIAAAMGVDASRLSVEQAAARAADAVQELIAELGLPQHIQAYGLTDADLEAAVEPLASEAYPRADLLGVMRAAW